MSDILFKQERRSPLSLLKAPPKQPKTVAVQARVEESVKTQLELYAEFIDASPSYVITEALKLLFRKDDDFKHWADQHTQTTTTTKKLKETFLRRPSNKHEVPSNPIRCVRAHSIPKTACLAPCSRFLAIVVRDSVERFTT